MENLFDVGQSVDIGMRDYQQDSLGIRYENNGEELLIVLADGMGGHKGGDVASNNAVTAFGQSFGSNTEKSVDRKLFSALHSANNKVCELARSTPEIKHMGTTLIGVSIVGGQAYWISIGDSLLYIVRNNTLEKLNEEHSLKNHFNKLYDAGKITKDELESVTDPHAVTSSIGMEEIVEIDNPKIPIDILEGDYLVIASDGILTLSDREIADSIMNASTAQKGADNIISRIKSINSADQDNVSVIVVRRQQVQNVKKSLTERLLVGSIVVTVLLLSITLLFWTNIQPRVARIVSDSQNNISEKDSTGKNDSTGKKSSSSQNSSKIGHEDSPFQEGDGEEHWLISFVNFFRGS